MTTLTPQIVLRAYSQGIFPMAEERDDPMLYWIDPEPRGILPLDAFHVPRRLARKVRHDLFEALPLPFRLWLSLRMRPHRVWTDSAFEVKIRSSPDTSPLEIRGTGITSVTFLNPLPSPA